MALQDFTKFHAGVTPMRFLQHIFYLMAGPCSTDLGLQMNSCASGAERDWLHGQVVGGRQEDSTKDGKCSSQHQFRFAVVSLASAEAELHTLPCGATDGIAPPLYIGLLRTLTARPRGRLQTRGDMVPLGVLLESG